MSRSPDETYVQTYQKYLKQKGSSEEFRRAKGSQTASTKVLKPVPKIKECKICKVLTKPGDVCKVLNQGLFHKYTASQDYFYTRDINALINKKRKPFSIRYYDDLTYDECRERLKGYFKKNEAAALMDEIKDFYTKFRNFPRNFQPHFYHIINSNIRKHRRLEYIRVFKGVNFEEEKPIEDKDDDEKDSRMETKDECLNFMGLLGESFLKDNYKDVSDVKIDKRRDTDHSLREIERNFRALCQLPPNTIHDPSSEHFSNALYNKNYMLYSRRDSETAEDMLREIVTEFKEANYSQKASMTLAEKVLHQVASTSTHAKKLENRTSPKLKQRGAGGQELSPSLEASKKSLGPPNNLTITLSQLQKPNQPTKPSKRGASNPRTSSQVETEAVQISSKLSQSKLTEQGKSTTKFSVEQLNDMMVDRSKILSKLYQFRSTRSKSGGLKSMSSANKTSMSKIRRPMGLNCDNDTQGYDSVESNHAQTAYYTHYKSQSPSVERKRPKEEPEKTTVTTDIGQSSQTPIESPYCNTMKRSTSQGPGMDMREMNSPVSINPTTKPTHKKSNSVSKRTTATPKKHMPNPSLQNFMLNTNNNSISGHNASQSNQENANSPNMKFINPLRSSALGSSQIYYFRHQSPLEEKMAYAYGDKKVKNLNMRALKNTSPKRFENSRVGTTSMSGRRQNLSDLSQGVNSFLGNQSAVHTSKNSSQALKRKKVGKADVQILAAKVNKGNSIIQGLNEDTYEKDRKGKKPLDLSGNNYNSFKDLKLQSKEQTPSNIIPSSTTSLTKFKVEVKRNAQGSYTVKGSSKDLRFTLKK